MLKKFLLPVVAMFLFLPGKTQLPEIGQAFPSFLIRDVLNGPSATVDVQQVADAVIIINFWGTWCSPCLPEMDSLGLLQKKYAGQVRIIAVASDPIDRVSKYLEKKPTSVWVSSDTNFYMYRFLGFDYVGQSVVLNKDRRMLAFVRTDSINDRFLKSLTNARPVHSSAERSSRVGFQSDEQDPFPADSQRIQRWVYESYRPGRDS